jgi:hypothetical protein
VVDKRQTVIVGKTFLDEHLDLTGQVFRGCRFSGCVLELWRSIRKAQFDQCTFEDCRHYGDGWPE